MPPVAPAARSRSCRTCPGPKLRIGKLRDGVAEFKPGDHTTFVCGPNGGEGDASRLFITYAGLASTVERDEIMYLADGAVRLRVSAVRPDDGEIDAVVEVGGAVASRQGLNIPGETAALPSVPEEDFEHVRTGERIGVDIIAVSFVRRADDITQLRAHTRLPLVAKIEKPQAVDARGGDRARRRLRDGRARRPRRRDADRGGPDRAEADHRPRRARWRGR